LQPRQPTQIPLENIAFDTIPTLTDAGTTVTGTRSGGSNECHTDPGVDEVAHPVPAQQLR
jgi:hypothetical protein